MSKSPEDAIRHADDEAYLEKLRLNMPAYIDIIVDAEKRRVVMHATDDYRTAIVISSWRENLCIVRDTASGKQYGFDLPTVEGYRGQTAKELSLNVGKVVRIKTDGDIVTSVRLS